MKLISSDASNYEYVNARVKSRRSTLFSEDEYRKLVRMGPGEISRFMEESEYEAEINALGSRHSGVDLIEYALHANLAKHFDDLLQWADGRLYDLIARYLRKFDGWNAKTVIRGVYSDADRDLVEADLIRAGEFDERFLERLLDATSVEETVDLLSDTLFGEALAEAYDDYEATGLLVPLENAIDRAYYEGLMEGIIVGPDRATDLYVAFLRAEIDFRNIRNALRLSWNDVDIDPAEYFIQNGKLFEESELNQLAGNTEELVARIRASRYGDDLAEALDELEAVDSLIGLEHALDTALLKYSDHLSHVFPLSVCPVFAYVLAKEREVDNIRAIARGHEAGLPEDEIEEELVLL